MVFNVQIVPLESNFLLFIVCSIRRKIKAGRSQLHFCMGFYHAIFCPKVLVWFYTISVLLVYYCEEFCYCCYFRVPVKKEKKPTSERKASVSEDLSRSNEKGENVMDVNSGGDKGSQKGGEDGEQAPNSRKQGKKEKGRRKNMSQNKAKLRKEARELRLASLSEGLENVMFSGLKMDFEDNVENEDSDVEKLVNSIHNGLINGKSKKKSKVYKRKTDETGHDTMTNKKMR